jgi:hypothetical protein
MNTNAIFVSALTTMAVCAAYFIGRAHGISRGRNLQWVDDYFNNVEKLKKLRDDLGRFQEQKTKNKIK